MPTVAERAEAFAALHRQGCFVMPNPWDVGSAKVLATYGFKALATTSAGHAFSLGKPDGAVGRDMALEHARAMVAATDLPVSGDLENLYGDAPETCAETVRLAAATGLAGSSIEDATGRADAPIYPFDAAVARVRAAVAAAQAVGRPFTLTARSENFLHGRADLDDTVRRLTAFAEAGADVLYAPALPDDTAIAAVVRAVAPKPVNVLVSRPGRTVAGLTGLGVRRISVGSALSLAAFGALIRAAEEMARDGTFGFAAGNAPYGRLNDLFKA